MKRIISLLFLLTVPLCLHPAFAQEAAPVTSASDAEASSVINRYFGALANGDVATLKTVLGGGLLKKRTALLNNPEYPGYLSATYMNATFKVLSVDASNPDSVAIDAVIMFNNDESIRKRYTLEKSASEGAAATYRIVSEISPAEVF